MQRSGVSKLLRRLGAEYPEEPISAARVDLWADVLGHVADDHADEAALRWLAGPSCRYFPKAGQILALAQEVADEEWLASIAGQPPLPPYRAPGTRDRRGPSEDVAS